MFKKKSSFKQKLFSVKLYFAIFCFGFVFSHFVVAFDIWGNNDEELKPLKFLWDLYTDVQVEMRESEMVWWTKVSNLYQESLKKLKNQEFLVQKETIKLVTEILNKRYNCIVSEEIIADVMVISDDTFAKNLQDAFFDVHNKESVIKESVALREWCSILTQCMVQRNSVSPHSLCKDVVRNAYYDAYNQNIAIQKMDQENYGTNLFQNWNDEDSDYDLMIDIQNIWEILFQGFKPPVETLFYRLPDMSNSDWFWWDVFDSDAVWTIGNFGNSDSDWSFGFGAMISGWEQSSVFVEWFDCPLWIEYATNTVKTPAPWTVLQNNHDWWVVKPISNPNYVNDFADVEQEDDLVQMENFEWLWVVWNSCAEFSECGNWVLEWLEECDDGGLEPEDGCSPACKIEFCWDGFVQNWLAEECDRGYLNKNSTSCTQDCLLNVCWDNNLRNWVEECDDGDLENWDGCSSSCRKEWWEFICGDWIENTTFEQCDDDNNLNTDWCLNSCLDAKCWDGFIREFFEDCDDGDLVSGDGCSSLCESEAGPYCGDWEVNNNEKCDEWDKNDNNWTCKLDCTENICWDWYILEWSEQCDDGNTNHNDCCDSSCQDSVHLTPDQVMKWILDSANADFNLNPADIKVGKEQNSCFANCQELPIDAKMACVAQCTCSEFSSPDLMWWILDEWAFRIKFCSIPAKPVQVTRWVRVFSIEEIIVEYWKIMKSLKDSGEMQKNSQTKEFLELWLKKNDFGKMFSFNLFTNWKKPLEKSTDTKAGEKAKLEDDNLKLVISNFSDDMDSFAKRNKYVVIQDVAKDKVYDKWDYETYLYELQTFRNQLNNFPQVVGNVVGTVVMEKQLSVLNEISSFLDFNLAFTNSFVIYLQAIADSMDLWSQKIKSWTG